MEEGKLFVVIIVLSIILTGIAVYLFFLDKKIRKIEDRVDSDKTKDKSAEN